MGDSVAPASGGNAAEVEEFADGAAARGGRKSAADRLASLRTVVSHVDKANKMLLERVRTGTRQVMSSPVVRRWAPAVLAVALLVYLILGAAAFFCFEHSLHEAHVRRWFMNLAVNRRHFARSISTNIFNDTRNLLIIIDRDQTERVQQILVNSLKRYEERLSLEQPAKLEWNLLNSFNYAYGLLLTLGHSAKTPSTTGGQVFSLVYCVAGIPLFFTTLALLIRQYTLSCIKKVFTSTHGRRCLLYLLVVIYVAWLLLIAVFLACYVTSGSFWNALYAAVFAALTIQVNNYDDVSAASLLVLLLLVTMSLCILLLIVFLFCDVYCCEKEVEVEDGSREDSGGRPPKFTVVVDESGETRLAH